MSNVRVTNGGASLSMNLAGYTVEAIREEPLLQDGLDLTGDESAEVRHSPDSCFSSVDDDYVLQDGDELKFTRQSGRKG